MRRDKQGQRRGQGAFYTGSGLARFHFFKFDSSRNSSRGRGFALPEIYLPNIVRLVFNLPRNSATGSFGLNDRIVSDVALREENT